MRPRLLCRLTLLAAFTALSLLLLLSACASLPDFEALRPISQPVPVRVISTRGELSPKKSLEVIEKLTQEGDSGLLREHLPFMLSLGGAPLTVGNEARLLVDGPQAYAAMFRAITAARDHVHLETYILQDDEVGHRLADLLVRKRAEGVAVRVLYDSVGSLGTSSAYFKRLSDSGIDVLEFNPINPIKGRNWRINHRDHRKILIVDGRIAFTGGINISSVYSTGSARPRSGRPSVEEGWRDTQIEIRGPAVGEFQRLFIDSWQRQNGPSLPAGDYFPARVRQGDKVVQVIGTTPDDQTNGVYLSLLAAISRAERSIHITMAYFVPDSQTLEALIGAARRGVKVTLVLPGFSDFWAVFHAGRSHYETLLAAGVEIYERRDALLHAKTAVIDEVWSTVGSANIDLRSFLHNDEVNAIILGEEFARQMEALFQADLARSTAVEFKQWARRPAHLRLRERLARMWEYWL